MTTQLRAKKGGEKGVNGEWYKGGAFIATTDKYSKGASKVKKLRKSEIEPYKWEFQPNAEALTIWSQIQHFVKLENGKAEFIANEQTIEYYKIDIKLTQRLINMFNEGQRWIDF